MRRWKRWLILATLLTAGCAGAIYDRAETSWNAWIGSSKDDRVKDLGIPTRCHTFKSGGEVCEWPVRWNAELGGTMTVQFDSRGNACQWTYRDLYEERRSRATCS
jgi:hypothetical protein